MQILKDYFSQIDLNEVRVLSFPDIYFMFGGSCNTDPNEPPPSIREALLRHLALKMPNVAMRIIIVEDIQSWSDGNLFVDLLDFENHLAHLAKLIVLIVESAGSIAELGSFAILPTIKSRLFVVISQKYNDEKSFISLGPIKRLRNEYNSVYVYPWSTSSSNGNQDTLSGDDIPEIIDDLAKDLKVQIDKSASTTKLSSNDPGHISLLICEVLSIATTLKLHEIETALLESGIEISLQELQRNLFCLSSLELVSVFTYGNETFYFSKTQNRHVSLQLKETSLPRLRDRARVISEFSEYYKENDSRRWKAIASYNKKLSGLGGAS